MKLSKLNFHTLISLTQKQPWLSDKVMALENMLITECSNQQEADLILELLSRFKYISGEIFGKMLTKLVDSITSNQEFSDNTTQIVAMAADSGSDSSQYILYLLKPLFQKNGWVDHLHVNRFGKAYSAYKKRGIHKNIILVDEFIGSGSTAKNRVDEINRIFNSNGISDFTVRVEVLVSSQIGMDYLLKSGIKVNSQIILPRGITDFYSPEDVYSKIELMKRLESLLKDRVGDRDLPSLGYGETESLYCRESGNSPNSVFPIFWWPVYKDNSQRPTVLIRAMGDA